MPDSINKEDILKILHKSRELKKQRDAIAEKVKGSEQESDDNVAPVNNEDNIKDRSTKEGLKELDKEKIEKALKIAQETGENMVTVGGILVKPTGELSRKTYLDRLKPDLEKYDGYLLTEEEALRVSRLIGRYTTGVNAAVPLTCTGSMCPFASGCPYVEIGKPPVGKPCLVEAQLIHYWTEQFMEEFDVDPNNLTEAHLVSELAEFNIYEMRVTRYLAEHHQTLMQDVVTAVDSTGEVIENKEVSRAFELKERIKKNRMKVLEALMATRKERVKLAETSSGESSTAEKLTEMKKKLDEYLAVVAKQHAVDAETIPDED